MTITRDVVIDLLPLYFSQEASPDTRTLVEEYFSANPDFAVKARESAPDYSAGGERRVPRKDLEMKALTRSRRLVRQRSFILGFAILFSLAPFSFECHEGIFHWVYRDAPVSAMIYGAVGLIFWCVYIVSSRRIRTIGL